MGGNKGPLRGPKTHRADQKLNRGEHEAPKPDTKIKDEDKGETRRQEQARDEHPTRMTERGYRT